MSASTSGNGPRARSGGPGPGWSGGWDIPGGPIIDIYARLSFAPNGETVKVNAQIGMGKDDIAERGARVGEIFTDNSKSAWDRNVVRKDWLRLMDRLERRVSHGLWVLHLDRFTRKPIEGERLIEAAYNGMHVWSRYAEYDLTTGDGRSDFRTAIQAAAKESDRNSERTRDGKLRAIQAGLSYGGERAWAQPGLVPLTPREKKEFENLPPRIKKRYPRVAETEERVAAERAVAAECITRILAGESAYALSSELNERGAAGDRAALPVSGRPWSQGALLDVLRRPSTAGLLHHYGEIVGRLDGVVPAVERQTWERFLAKMDARTAGRPPSEQHTLSGSLYCGTCGARMMAYLRPHQTPYEDGSPRREYRCPSPKVLRASVIASRGGVPSCGHNGIDARVAERAVLIAVPVRLRDSRRTELVAAEMQQASAQRAEITDKIERKEEEADKLTKKVHKWGVDRVDSAMSPILEEIKELRAQLAQFGDENMLELSATSAVAKWDRVCEEGDVIEQRRIIRRVFPNLTVAPREYRGDQRESRLLWDGPVPTPTAGE